MRISDYIAALPDVFKKHERSNNYKLLLIDQTSVEDLWKDIELLRTIENIQNATGETLDLYGDIYGQARGALTDEQFRVVVLQAAARNLAGGDYNSTIEAMANALGVDPGLFSLREEIDPRQVVVEDLPYSAILGAGLSPEQLTQLISGFLPAGIPLAPVELGGTFEFSAGAADYDTGKGFGNIEQTIGGYFGLLASSDANVPV